MLSTSSKEVKADMLRYGSLQRRGSRPYPPRVLTLRSQDSGTPAHPKLAGVPHHRPRRDRSKARPLVRTAAAMGLTIRRATARHDEEAHGGTQAIRRCLQAQHLEAHERRSNSRLLRYQAASDRRRGHASQEQSAEPTSHPPGGRDDRRRADVRRRSVPAPRLTPAAGRGREAAGVGQRSHPQLKRLVAPPPTADKGLGTTSLMPRQPSEPRRTGPFRSAFEPASLISRGTSRSRNLAGEVLSRQSRRRAITTP